MIDNFGLLIDAVVRLVRWASPYCAETRKDARV